MEGPGRAYPAGRYRWPQPERLDGVFGAVADSAAVVTDITLNSDPEARTRKDGSTALNRDSHVLVVGGSDSSGVPGFHAVGARSTDLLLSYDREPVRFDMPHQAASMRGIACMLASAVAADLAKAEVA